MWSKSSRSETFFLSTTRNLRNKSHSWLTTNIEGSNTFWSINLMPRYTQQINIHIINIKRYLTKTLSCISMEVSFVLSADFTYFLYWLNYTYFIVQMDYRAQKSVWTDCLLEVIEFDETSFFLDWEVCHIKSFVFKTSAGVQNTFMIYLCRNNVFSFVTIKLRNTFQTEVIALSGSWCKDYLFWSSANNASNVLSRIFTCLLGVPAKLVWFWVWIAVIVGKVWQHRIKNSWISGCRRLIIKIQWEIWFLLLIWNWKFNAYRKNLCENLKSMFPYLLHFCSKQKCQQQRLAFSPLLFLLDLSFLTFLK